MDRSPFEFSLSEMFRSALIILPAVLELLLLRAVVVNSLGHDNTAFGMYARDVLLPLMLGGFLFLCYLQRETALVLKLRAVAVPANFVLLSSAVLLLLASTAGRLPLSAEGTMAGFFALGLAALSSSLFLFVSPSRFLAALRSLGRKAWNGVLGLGLLFCYPQILKWGWHSVAHSTGWSVGKALALLGVPVAVSAQRMIEIHHPRMVALIDISCSGLEGIFFFSFFLLLIRTFEKKPSGWRFEVVSLLLGVIFMFLLNVARISFFFLAGLTFSDHQQHSFGNEFFVWGFHSNVGWLLYFSGLVLFFQLRHRARERAG